MLLDYASTYPNAVIQYHDSDIVLHVDSDTSYLVIPYARSFTAGIFLLSNWTPPNLTQPNQTLNEIVPSSLKSNSSRTLYLFQKNLKQLVCQVLIKGPYKFYIILFSLGKLRIPPQSKHTTLLLMDFSIQRQIQNAQKHGVCAITIYMTEKPSNNYECVGVKDQTTMQVILLNIILIFTIAK